MIEVQSPFLLVLKDLQPDFGLVLRSLHMKEDSIRRPSSSRGALQASSSRMIAAGLSHGSHEREEYQSGAERVKEENDGSMDRALIQFSDDIRGSRSQIKEE